MKKIQLIIIIGMILIFPNLFSQDFIILKNGEEIKSKVIEISMLKIKYKKFSNIDGPDYTIDKSEVFMIKYENGEKDVFNEKKITEVNQGDLLKVDFTGFGMKLWKGSEKINRSEFNSLFGNNSRAYNQYQLGRSIRTAGFIIGIPSAVILGWNLGTWIGSEEQPNETVLIISGIGFVGSIIMEYIGRAKIRSAVDIYNNSSSLSLNLIMNKNGIGLALQF